LENRRANEEQTHHKAVPVESLVSRRGGEGGGDHQKKTGVIGISGGNGFSRWDLQEGGNPLYSGQGCNERGRNTRWRTDHTCKKNDNGVPIQVGPSSWSENSSAQERSSKKKEGAQLKKKRVSRSVRIGKEWVVMGEKSTNPFEKTAI